jgi:ATP-dependent Clp protease ATP-binding subunit ClpA
MNELDELFAGKRRALESYTRDLTAAALRDELEPVTCREAEMDRLIAILLRQSKNNPVLVGEAGVGKTAIVEGFARRIVEGRVPESLKRSKVVMLSHLDLIAGSSFRGQFEKRLQGVIDEAIRNPDVILFIDELHNLIGAGVAIGQPLDAANLIKPALSRGELRVIGATTRDEYERFIQPDAALERRFHPVEVIEMGRDQTLEVLLARRPRLELYHSLVITDAAIEAAFSLSQDRAVYAGRKQPDKSLDLIDEACAFYRLRDDREMPEEIIKLKAERSRLIEVERKASGVIREMDKSRVSLFERFSIDTYNALEEVGLELERLFTGHKTTRPPAPVADQDPAADLAEAQRERSQIEARLRESLAAAGFIIDLKQVEEVGK